MTTVYIDRVFVLNLAVDYLLLLTTACVGGAVRRRGRCALCAALGALYAVGVFLLPLLNAPLLRLAAGLAMALLAFCREGKPLRLTALFLLLSAGLAGMLLALGLAAGSGSALLRRVYTADISWPVLLLSSLGFYLLLLVLFRRGAEKGGDMIDVTIFYGGRRCRLRALHDTGNALRDPVRGQAVLVAERGALLPLWAPEVAAIVAQPQPPERRMAQLAGQGFLLLPYTAVGTPSGLLLTMRTTAVQIGKRTIPQMLVAITDSPLGAGYQALWGGGERGRDAFEAVGTPYTASESADRAG